MSNTKYAPGPELSGQPIANCEECGVVIPAEYALCQHCEEKLYGTVDGIPVNVNEDDTISTTTNTESR